MLKAYDLALTQFLDREVGVAAVLTAMIRVSAWQGQYDVVL